MCINSLCKGCSVLCGPYVENIYLLSAICVSTLRNPSLLKHLNNAFKQSYKLQHYAEVELRVHYAGLEEACSNQEFHPEAPRLHVLPDKLSALRANIEGVSKIRNVYNYVNVKRDKIA